MTAKSKALIAQWEKDRYSLRDRVVAYMATLTEDDHLRIMVKAGILTKKGKLTRMYRPPKVAV